MYELDIQYELVVEDKGLYSVCGGLKTWGRKSQETTKGRMRRRALSLSGQNMIT